MKKSTIDSKHSWFRLYLDTEWQRFFGINATQITPLLFVGGQFRPSQWPGLVAMGVRAVLSLRKNHEDTFSGTPPEHYLRVLVKDHYAPSIEQLTQAVAFIAAAHADNLPVLVHCHAGIGRAPTTAAAYLMATQSMDYRTAVQSIAIARPIINLNTRQRQRLREWHEYISAPPL